MVHCVQFERSTSAVHTLGRFSAVGRGPCTDEDGACKRPSSTAGVVPLPGCVGAHVSAVCVSTAPDFVTHASTCVI